jgi:dephospho-CoA kinase
LGQNSHVWSSTTVFLNGLGQILVLKVLLAITGGIACGKSVVGTLLSRRGIPVCDADDVSHEALDGDVSVRAAVLASFGVEMLREGGVFDRRRLGAVVFKDAAARARLEAILHPIVLRRMQEWAAEQSQRHDIVAGIVPLLYEIGEQAKWDVVLCVTTTAEIQVTRLATRGLSGAAAIGRIAAQMAIAEKMKRADFVVSNQGSLAMLDEQVDRVLRRIRRELA